jgi:ubiquinone/menaquinone biosynthesis C-methylase UbiE
MICNPEKNKSMPRWRRKLQAIFVFNQYERDCFVQQWSSNITPNSQVLDVGAGPCQYRFLFSHCRYYSQDFAKYHGCEEGPLADKDCWNYGQLDMVADAARLPVADATFDAVLCTEVLEHIPEPVAMVKEIGRVLRPQGKLLLTAPLGSGVHQEPYHYYGGFTPYWYQRFLPEAGFDKITVTPNGGFFRHYGQESQRVAALLAPGNLPVAPKWLTPLWLLSWPWFRIIMPLCCHWLDHWDSHRGFTVGYFVTAEKI